jgi:acyl carrier protein
MTDIKATVRQILAQHGRLPGDVTTLGDDDNLYDAGLTSLATVGVMLALENHLDLEFPESTLGRKTFQSIGAIADAVAGLKAGAGAVPVGA